MFAVLELCKRGAKSKIESISVSSLQNPMLNLATLYEENAEVSAL